MIRVRRRTWCRSEILGALLLLSFGLAGCGPDAAPDSESVDVAETEPTQPPPEPSAPGLPAPQAPGVSPRGDQGGAAAVRAELARRGEQSADAIVAGAPPRAIVLQPEAFLPHGGSRSYILIALAPGPPTNLAVPSELGIRFWVERPEGSAPPVVEGPDPADVVAAVRLALETEEAAVDAALRVMEASDVPVPAGAAQWRDAIRMVSLDPRLPRARLVGEPSWQVIFDPWREPGGYPAVLLEARTQRILTRP